MKNRGCSPKRSTFKKRRLIARMVVLPAVILLFLSGCTTVKPYQKMYLNDPDMQLKARDVEAYEISCESYREGSSGAHGGKSGGGCGCF